MDPKQQLVSNLVEFISQSVSLNRRLDKKRVDTATAKLVFTQLDKKRKGYLDLADVYSLCGEVSENDLFVVFKWLDASKTGDVTYEDFEWAVATRSESQKKDQTSPLESVKTVITTFLENWDYSNGTKAKFGINESSLSQFYKWACQWHKKNSLTLDDFFSIFSSSKNFDSLCKEYLKNAFKSAQFINEKTFVEAFECVGECEAEAPSTQNPTVYHGKSQNYSTESNEEQLLDDINHEYSSKRQPVTKFSSQGYDDVNKFIQEKYPKALLERENHHAATFSREQVKASSKEPKVPERKETDFKNGDIESLLNNIEKRREQLRKGSLERKKLIEEALSRKKITTVANLNVTEQFEPKSYARPLSTPKSNSYSQVCLNHFVEANKNDFTKVLDRYREEKQNVSNFESKLSEKKFDFKMKEPEWNQFKGSKFMDKAYSSPPEIPPFDLKSILSQQSDTRKDFYRSGEAFMTETPKFSQTANDKFFERPQSSPKRDRIEQIREKISYLPDKNPITSPKEARQIDRIIEKYRNVQPSQQSPKNYQIQTQPFEMQDHQHSHRYEEARGNGFSAFLNQSSSSNFRGIDNFSNYQPQQRATPDSYIQDQKSRLNGSIYQYRASTGSIQKENLLKRAEEEAARKIHEIERKAKLKVLERKTAVGLKWVK